MRSEFYGMLSSFFPFVKKFADVMFRAMIQVNVVLLLFVLAPTRYIFGSVPIALRRRSIS